MVWRSPLLELGWSGHLWGCNHTMALSMTKALSRVLAWSPWIHGGLRPSSPLQYWWVSPLFMPGWASHKLLSPCKPRAISCFKTHHGMNSVFLNNLIFFFFFSSFPFYLIKDWWININTAQWPAHSSYCAHTDQWTVISKKLAVSSEMHSAFLSLA